jgi:cold shock CspA family protein
MNYTDKQIACRECGGRFVFTAGEQEFYAGKGLINEPTRCPEQRRARKYGAPLTGWSCRYDVSGSGRRRPTASDAGRDGQPEQRDNPPRRTYDGPLPTDPVAARVLRIDPAGRFLFARVEAAGFDVYVHHTLFRDVSVREGDEVHLQVEASDRGPRARSLRVEP